MEHEHNQAHVADEHQHTQKDPSSNLALSVVAGAILICASIFYNTSLLVKSLEGNTTNQPNIQAAVGQAAPSPAPAAGPVKVADRNNQPTTGNKNVKVTVIEFADFQCPFCQRFFNDTFPQIKSAYIDTGKIQYIFRHFPLTQIHANAEISSVAAECANQQGKFWEYHDLLYKNGKGDGTGLDKASLEKYGDQLGLNKGALGFGNNKFNQCLESNATLKIVQADQAEGAKDGVNGTPTFFINGQKIVGAQPFATLQQAIDAALK